MPRSSRLGHIHPVAVKHVRMVVVLLQLGLETVVILGHRTVLRLGRNVSRRLRTWQPSTLSSTSLFGLASLFALLSFPLPFLPSRISSTTKPAVLALIPSATLIVIAVAVTAAVTAAVAVVSPVLLPLQIVKVPFLDIIAALSGQIAAGKRRRLLESQRHVAGICALVTVMSLTAAMVAKDAVGAVGAPSVLDIVSPDQMALVLGVDA